MKSTQKVVLVSIGHNGKIESARRVLIAEDHDWAGGPYADTVPFSVGSNQYLIPDDECLPENVSDLLDA
jgi:hypothetical protein